MFERFPILSEEKIKEYTEKGYVLVFRLMKAINEERAKDIVTRTQTLSIISGLILAVN